MAAIFAVVLTAIFAGPSLWIARMVGGSVSKPLIDLLPGFGAAPDAVVVTGHIFLQVMLPAFILGYLSSGAAIFVTFKVFPAARAGRVLLAGCLASLALVGLCYLLIGQSAGGLMLPILPGLLLGYLGTVPLVVRLEPALAELTQTTFCIVAVGAVLQSVFLPVRFLVPMY